MHEFVWEAIFIITNLRFREEFRFSQKLIFSWLLERQFFPKLVLKSKVQKPRFNTRYSVDFETPVSEVIFASVYCPV